MKKQIFVRWLFVFLLCSTALAEDKGAVKAWKKYHEQVKKTLAANDWGKASELLQLEVKEAEKLGPEDERLVETLRLQSHVYIQLRDYAEAEPICRRTLEISEKKHGTNHLEVARDLENMAEVCGFLEWFDEADKHLQRAQSILEWKHGSSDPIVGICVAQRAGIYLMADRLDEAEAAFQKALRLIALSRTETHLEINQIASESSARLRPEYRAYLMNDLGLVHCRQKKYDEAEKDLTESIKIREREFGKNSVKLVGGLNNMGMVYDEQKKWPEAEKVLQRSWLIVSKSVALSHPIVAEVRQHLIRVLKAEGKESEARALAGSAKKDH